MAAEEAGLAPPAVPPGPRRLPPGLSRKPGGSYDWANELADAMADSFVNEQQLQPPQGVVAGFSSEAELRAEAKKAEAWAQHVQNDEVDGWSAVQ